MVGESPHAPALVAAALVMLSANTRARIRSIDFRAHAFNEIEAVIESAPPDVPNRITGHRLRLQVPKASELEVGDYLEVHVYAIPKNRRRRP